MSPQKMELSEEEKVKRALEWTKNLDVKTVREFANNAYALGFMTVDELQEFRLQYYSGKVNDNAEDMEKVMKKITEVAGKVQKELGMEYDGGAIGPKTDAKMDQALKKRKMKSVPGLTNEEERKKFAQELGTLPGKNPEQAD